MAGGGVESPNVAIAGLVAAGDEIGVLLVELAVVELHFDGDRTVQLFGEFELVVNDLSGPGRNLVIVEGREDVLRVATVDPSSIHVQQEDVDKVRPRINLAIGVELAAGSDHPLTGADGHLEPDLVRIDGALGEQVTQFDCADHRVEQVTGSGLQCRDRGTQWRMQSVRKGPAVADSEQIDPHRASQEFLLRGDHVRAVAEPGDPSVGTGEQMIVDLQLPAVTEWSGSEVVRGDQGHVAPVAVGLGLRRVVEAGSPMTQPGEQKRVVVVLSADEGFLVAVAVDLLELVQRQRQVHLVADAAELGCLVVWFEERLLVEIGLGFDQLVVDPLQHRVVAVRERVMQRFLDGVVGVAPVAVDVRDRVADGAGDTRVSGGVVDVVVVLLIEGPAEEWHGIVAAGTPSRGADVAVVFERDLSCLADTGQVGGVVERTESVDAVGPGRVCVGVTLLAVAVHHQGFTRDEFSAGGSCQ